MNNQIRGFLRHNQVRPNAVTVGNADAFIKNDAPKCRIQLSKTPYCLLAEANTGPDVAIDYWYDEPQSCLSFCYNIVESARSDSGRVSGYRKLRKAIFLNVGNFEEEITVKRKWVLKE